MAITTATGVVEQVTPQQVLRVRCSTLVAAKTENVSHGGPSGVSPSEVRFEVVTQPDSSDPVFMAHISGSDSASGGTMALRFDTVAGGDLTGAVVDVFCHFVAHASGGFTDVS